jgi:cellobiose phosphorylase
MANWSQRYKETFIPQGTVYEYNLGVSACIRDHLQHMLPLCYYDQDLARSILRFALKKTDFRGDILTSDEGAGNYPIGGDMKSDNQIYFFMALAEYLNVSKDGDFLTELVPFRGAPQAPSGTVFDRVRRCFLYLRDVVSTGDHGLVRMLCADWNDCLYSYFKEIPYHTIFRKGESHLNTAMAVSVLGDLLESFDALDEDSALKPWESELADFTEAVRVYRTGLLDALLRDWGDGPFLKRAYIGTDNELGESSMIYEPQPHLLAIPEIPLEKRKALWQQIRNRVYDPEQKGARQSEVPLGSSDAGGSRENGGFWYALNGPLIKGLLELDPGEAEKAAQKMTLLGHAEQFPDYWVGMWSGPDSFDSSLLPSEGMSSSYTREFPVFCAHAHAWPLYSLIKINEYRGEGRGYRE